MINARMQIIRFHAHLAHPYSLRPPKLWLIQPYGRMGQYHVPSCGVQGGRTSTYRSLRRRQFLSGYIWKSARMFSIFLTMRSLPIRAPTSLPADLAELQLPAIRAHLLTIRSVLFNLPYASVSKLRSTSTAAGRLNNEKRRTTEVAIGR